MRTAILFLSVVTLFGQSRPVPPPGVPVSDADRKDLQDGLARLGKSIESLHGVSLAPDVEIYHKAVRYALENNEFFRPEEIGRARELLRQGQSRADELARGNASWNSATGLVVRGYVSRIDRSVQPYSLVIPASWSPSSAQKWRLDAWFHGRGETLSELNFIYDRQRQIGEFAPANTFVLHLYGRYCNANKFAGEVDLFEALEDVKKHYRIDNNRILVRGFSMGGAAAWQFATHFPGLWAAAAPGAGFAETPEFLNVFQREKVAPTAWEQKLWRMYNATDYALNLANLPVVAYSGEIDRQKQAADIMAKAMAEEGMELTHVIGPNTPHRYHPDSKVIIDAKLDAIAERGRDPYPSRVRFVTYTLRYNRMKWLRVDGLEQHWEKARAEAELTSTGLNIQLSNIDAFSVHFGPGASTLDITRKPVVVINGVKVTANPPMSDRSWAAYFVKEGGKWIAAPSETTAAVLRKRHRLQGPIDDAFMDSFVIVRPTGGAMHQKTGEWVKAEMDRAIREWRRQFRGDAQVRDDSAITEAEIAASNLVLWGDPQSNKLLARIADKLPVKWTPDAIELGGQKLAASTHVPLLVFPNPLNPRKYVVLNSGFTFREYDYLNNARQVPKLPDWAMVDVTTAPDDRWPGKVVDAGFFDERWRLPARGATR